VSGILFLSLLAVLPGQNLDRAQAESDFRSANERALEGDLTGAIELYRTLLERGIDGADVHYNLGNAYAQAGKPIDAILSYERALRRAPGDPDITENLRFVRKTLAGEREEAPASLNAADMMEPIVAPLPPVLFGWIAGGANVLLFLAWWVRRRSASLRRRRLLGALLGISLAALIVSLAVVGGHWVVARDPRGVIVTKTELREGPHPKFKSKGAATLGGRVRLLDEAEDFVQVLEEDGSTGWIWAQAVTRI
jgi:tetratricopeptide (TPR) repeat protein